MLIIALVGSTVLVAALGITHNFWLALVLLAFWGLIFALVTPVRQAYLNGLIASEHRATVLSFDNLLNSGGGAITQPILGRVADAHGYGASFLVSAAIGAGALPFLYLAKKQHASSDPVNDQAAASQTRPAD
jgi:MFS family permease